MPFVGRRTAQGYGCRDATTAGRLDRLELLDLVEVLGQTRRKRRKRMRMRIELVGRLGGVDHGTDAASVSNSSSSECGVVPLMMWARNTPAASASTAARSLGIIPLSTSPP